MDKESKNIILPCSLGDTIYSIEYGRIKTRKAIGFECTEEGVWVIWSRLDGDSSGSAHAFEFSEIGECVFFDRTEAETAFKNKE